MRLSAEIIKLLKSGKTLALLSDAGGATDI